MLPLNQEIPFNNFQSSKENIEACCSFNNNIANGASGAKWSNDITAGETANLIWVQPDTFTVPNTTIPLDIIITIPDWPNIPDGIHWPQDGYVQPILPQPQIVYPDFNDKEIMVVPKDPIEKRRALRKALSDLGEEPVAPIPKRELRHIELNDETEEER